MFWQMLGAMAAWSGMLLVATAVIVLVAVLTVVVLIVLLISSTILIEASVGVLEPRSLTTNALSLNGLFLRQGGHELGKVVVEHTVGKFLDVGHHTVLGVAILTVLEDLLFHIKSSLGHNLQTLELVASPNGFVDHALNKRTVGTIADFGHGIVYVSGHGLRCLLLMWQGVGCIDIELETRHKGKMIPHLLFVIVVLFNFWKKVDDDLDYGGSTGRTFGAVGNSKAIIDHALYVSPIFGHYQLLF